MPSNTPSRGGQKRNQSFSPDSSPQDKHVAKKTNENNGRKNEATVDTPFDPQDFLPLIQGDVDPMEFFARHAQDIASLVVQQMVEWAEIEKMEQRIAVMKSRYEETLQQIDQKKFKQQVGLQIYLNHSKYQYAKISLEQIKVKKNIPSTGGLLAKKYRAKRLLLQDLLENGIAFNKEVLEKVNDTTDPDELKRLQASGTIQHNSKRLKVVPGVELLEVQVNYRLVILLDMTCGPWVLNSLQQGLQKGLTINPCCVRTKGGTWGKPVWCFAFQAADIEPLTYACCVTIAEFTLPGCKVENQSRRYNVYDIERLLQLGSFPPHVVDNLSSLTLDAMEAEACARLFTALREYANDGTLSNVKKVDCSDFGSQSPTHDKPFLYRTLANCLQHGTPSLQTLVLTNNTVNDDLIDLLKAPLQAAAFVTLDDMGLSRVQDLFKFLGENKKGISYCDNSVEDVKALQQVKTFSQLQELRFGNLKRADAAAWASFTQGLYQMNPEQFRFLQLAQFNPVEVVFDALPKWLGKAYNLEFFVLSSADDISCQKLADVFNSMLNKEHLAVMEISSALSDDDDGTDSRAEVDGEDGAALPYDSDDDYQHVEWDDKLKYAFRIFAIGFPRNLTHLKLHELSLPDTELVRFFDQLNFKTKLQQLSLTGNKKLTTKAAAAICSAAKWLPALKYVDLSDTGISSHDYPEIRNLFATAFASESRSRVLQLRLDAAEEEDLLANWSVMWDAQK